MLTTPVLRDIVLLGGGHAHAVVVRQWAMKPVPGVRLTLISRDVLTPYSGMLPGLLAGHYTLEETHIDLSRLCRWAGVRFIQAEITGLDTTQKLVTLKDRPAFSFDVVSIDTGSTPDLNVPGADAFTVPVKPVHQFHKRWLQLLKRNRSRLEPLEIGVVGAGAGGFELLLSMQHRLNVVESGNHRFHWIVRGDSVLYSHNKRVHQRALQVCARNDIQVHWNFPVVEISDSCLKSDEGKQLPLDEIIWCTAATGPAWLASTDLQLDDRGFLAVNECLQSCSHEFVFAAGDIATQINDPRPKAGVFAVRAGPVLAKNLKRYVLQRSLYPYKPQKKFLSILASGGKTAIASKGRFSAAGKWVWRWKDSIDVRFMQKFNDLPPKKAMEQQPPLPTLFEAENEDWSAKTVRCAGCGAKIGSDVLSRVLSRLSPVNRDDMVYGLDSPDDAAVINPRGNWLVQSVDQIRSITDDPWLFARIATNHALSDLYAMNAEPQSAMVTITLPFACEAVQERDLEQVMQGIALELASAECSLSGGHSNEASELSIGLVVNGLGDEDKLTRKSGLQPGDKLILTKSLGTGVILAADMQARCQGQILQSCMRSMLQSNRSAAEILSLFGASAVTDVTGFGLAGHLVEMLRSSENRCFLDMDSLPLIEGAISLIEQGIQSTLYRKNERISALMEKTANWKHHPAYPLLFDPQTSGGLLASVPAESAQDCINALHSRGYESACIIGEICQSGVAQAGLIFQRTADGTKDDL